MLRPYQDRFCKSILTGFHEYQRLLGVMPTGGGKTICFAHLASISRGRTLILAHREELIDQAVDKITRFTGTPVSVEMGDRRSTPTKIVVASIQSMVRRKDQFKPDEFSLIVADEAHMSLSFQWRSVLDYFNSKVLGVTATPHRGDKQNLGKYYESCASEISMQELVAAGYLCRIKLIQFPVRIDIGAVRVTDGDYNDSDMDAVIRPLMKGIVEHLMEWRDRKILAFVPLIHTSVYLVEACRNAGLDAVHIDGTSPDRKQILERYSRGAFNILSNSMLLSHGYDEPSIDAVLLLRPTKSQPLMCLDLKTEILTDKGWKKHDEFDVGMNVGCFDIKSEKIDFVQSTDKIYRDLLDEEKFISLSGQSIDIRVTNQHRMIYDHKRKTGWKIITAERLASLKTIQYIPVSGNCNHPGIHLTYDELRFIGWTLTDGNINKKTNGISITQGEHQPWINEIEKCIVGCGFKFGKSSRWRKTQFNQTSKCVKWTISKGIPRGRDKHLTGWGRLEPWLDRNFSEKLYDCTNDQFDILLEAMHLGNGLKQSKAVGWTRRSYHIFTGKKELAERLQICGILHGYRSNLNKHLNCYVVHMKKQIFVMVGGKLGDRPSWEKELPKDNEKCWCVTNPVGTLITRRNGKVAIVGNCQQIGRGTRINPGKTELLVLDPIWIGTRHPLCRPVNLIATDEKESEMMARKVEEKDGWDLFELQSEVVSEREASIKKEIDSHARRNRREIDPLTWAAGIKRSVDIAEYQPVFVWEKQPPSPAQINLLKRFGISTEGIRYKGRASKLIGLIMDRTRSKLATPRQLILMEQLGIPDCDKLSFKDASLEIGRRIGANRTPNSP